MCVNLGCYNFVVRDHVVRVPYIDGALSSIMTSVNNYLIRVTVYVYFYSESRFTNTLAE